MEAPELRVKPGRLPRQKNPLKESSQVYDAGKIDLDNSQKGGRRPAILWDTSSKHTSWSALEKSSGAFLFSGAAKRRGHLRPPASEKPPLTTKKDPCFHESSCLVAGTGFANEVLRKREALRTPATSGFGEAAPYNEKRPVFPRVFLFGCGDRI